MTEAQEQANVFKWTQQPHIRSKQPKLSLLFYIHNDGRRNVAEGKCLKEQGVKSGISNLCLSVLPGKYHGLFIEMKTDRGRASPSPKWRIDRLNAS